MPLHYDRAVQRYPGHGKGRVEGPATVGKGRHFVRVVLAHGKGECSRFPSAAGTAGALEIVGRMRRYVVHAYDGNATDVYAHFHGGGTREHVDVSFPKFLRT